MRPTMGTTAVAVALAALLAAPPPATAQQGPAPTDAAAPPPPPPAAAPAPQAAAPPPPPSPPPPPPRRPPPGDPAPAIRLRDGDREIHVRCTPQESARDCAEVALDLAEQLGRGDRRRLGWEERDDRRERRDRDYGYEEY